MSWLGPFLAVLAAGAVGAAIGGAAMTAFPELEMRWRSVWWRDSALTMIVPQHAGRWLVLVAYRGRVETRESTGEHLDAELVLADMVNELEQRGKR